MLAPVRAHTRERCAQVLQCIGGLPQQALGKGDQLGVGYSHGYLVHPVQADLDNRSFRVGTKENPVRRRHLSTTERGAPGHTCHCISPRMTQAQPHLPSVTIKQDNTDTKVVSEKQPLQPEQSFISAGKHCFFFSLGFHWCLCVDVTVWSIP